LGTEHARTARRFARPANASGTGAIWSSPSGASGREGERTAAEGTESETRTGIPTANTRTAAENTLQMAGYLLNGSIFYTAVLTLIWPPTNKPANRIRLRVYASAAGKEASPC